MTLYIPDWAKPFTTTPKSLEEWDFIKQNIFIASVSNHYIDLIKSIVASNTALASEKIDDEIKAGGYHIKGDEHILKYILMNDIDTLIAIKIAEQTWDVSLKIFCNASIPLTNISKKRFLSIHIPSFHLRTSLEYLQYIYHYM